MQIIENTQPTELQQTMNQQFQVMSELVEIDVEISQTEQRLSDLKASQRLKIQDIAGRGRRIGKLMEEETAKNSTNGKLN